MTTTVILDGKPFPIRPTPLAKLGPIIPAISRLDATGQTSDGTAEAANALAEAVFHGIRRAGGEVSQEFVSDNIDMLNFREVFQVFAKVNGLLKDSGVGEAEAGAAS